MPLMPNILINELSKFIDEKSGLFDKFPSSKEDAADKWANAFDTYAKGVIPLSSGMNQAAISAFKGNFMSIKEDTDMKQLAQCFVLYAAPLALGMTTALPTMTGFPPSASLNLAPVAKLGMNGGSSAQCIQLLATTVDIWMRTGKAINNIPPAPPVTIPIWS